MNAPSPSMDTLSTSDTTPVILALPKGRILKAALPLLKASGIEPDPECMNENSRKLRFSTNNPQLEVIRVRSFDVATFVAYGAAHIGICGADVLMEFDYPEIYAPLDLKIGACRICVAEPVQDAVHEDPSRWSQIRVASKYPNITKKYFAAQGVQADIVHLHGAMELAPTLGLSRFIVDLVDTGSTLHANGLREIKEITHITSRLIVNRTALKTQPERINTLIQHFQFALENRTAA